MINYNYEVIKMNRTVTTQQAIANAAASVEMEGFHVTAQHKEWCRKLLNKEITKAEYIRLIRESAKGQSHAL
jgi:hypothetical protein